MLDALLKIGKALRGKYLIPFIQDPFPNLKNESEKEDKEGIDKSKGNNVKVLRVDLELQGRTLKLKDITLEDYKENYFVYYFRKPPSHGVGGLSFKRSGKNSTLIERLKILDELNYKFDIENIVQSIIDKLEELEKKQLIIKEGKNRTNLLITLVINGKYPNENLRFVNFSKLSFFDSLLSTETQHSNTKQIKSIPSKCHGCKKQTQVYVGMNRLLSFYSVDKHGFSPHLKPEESWKQFALCPICCLDIERAKRALDSFLQWKFYSKNMWILPEVDNEDFLFDILKEFELLHEELSGKVAKGQGYINTEDDLLFEASEMKHVTFFHFIFFHTSNSAFRIDLHLQNVLPSVISRFIVTKKNIETLFNNSFNMLKHKLHFSFFRDFSSKVPEKKYKKDFEKLFYATVTSVFTKSLISEEYVIKNAMKVITYLLNENRGKFNSKVKEVTLETLLSLEVLHNLDILKRKTHETVNPNKGGFMNDKYEKFFQDHSPFFDSPIKKGLVLLGILIQKFLGLQWAKLNHSPFVSKLKGMRLSQSDVESIFKDLRGKLDDYEGEHQWKALWEKISLYFIEQGKDWRLSRDEIGFYLTIGRSIADLDLFKSNNGTTDNEITSENL